VKDRLGRWWVDRRVKLEEKEQRGWGQDQNNEHEFAETWQSPHGIACEWVA
jgi:hypothetical protein